MSPVSLSGSCVSTPQHGRGLRWGACALLVLASCLGSATAVQVDKRSNLQTINGSTYVWAIEDTYQGTTFFEYVRLLNSLAAVSDQEL